MFLKFFVISLLILALTWYLHDYHTASFIAFTRKIPFVNELMTKLHSSRSSSRQDKINEQIFTKETLALYDGTESSLGLYIAILGKIYDVKKGIKHYGPGGSYHVFSGRDASRSFITGDFSKEGASDDVLDLPLSEILGLKKWQKFYQNDYSYVGKLVGRYYDERGVETEYHVMLNKKLEDAEIEKRVKSHDRSRFPPCNMEWDAAKGSRVWCSNKSGGIERTWVGVPRKLYEIGSENSNCVCIDLEHINDPKSPQYERRMHLEEYEDCPVTSTQCINKNK